MENQNEFVTNEQPKSFQTTIKFFGKGSDYFGIIIVNWLLTLITLGIYYPWARARKIKYMYGATALNDDRFAFLGTGKEMFRGFVKVILFYIVLTGLLVVAQMYQMKNPMVFLIAILLFYVIFIAIIPLIYHGAYRYRMSRTTWRGIRFGYRGSRKQLYIKFLKWAGLTIITFGIYSSWMRVNLRKYLLGNVRFGDAKFSYKGEGVDLFIINLKLAGMVMAGLFPAIVAGVVVAVYAGSAEMSNLMPIILLFMYLPALIYMFWYEKDIWNYYIDNIEIEKEEQKIQLKSTVTGGGIFGLRIVNLLMTIFSLGLAYAWVEVRTRKYFTEHTHIKGDIDLDKITQTEEVYTDAMFEDAGDFFDIDIF